MWIYGDMIIMITDREIINYVYNKIYSKLNDNRIQETTDNFSSGSTSYFLNNINVKYIKSVKIGTTEKIWFNHFDVIFGAGTGKTQIIFKEATTDTVEIVYGHLKNGETTMLLNKNYAKMENKEPYIQFKVQDQQIKTSGLGQYRKNYITLSISLLSSARSPVQAENLSWTALNSVIDFRENNIVSPIYDAVLSNRSRLGYDETRKLYFWSINLNILYQHNYI